MESTYLPALFYRLPALKPTFRRLEKQICSVFRLKNQKHFLEECLQEQVVPKMYGLSRWTLNSVPFPRSHKLFLEERIAQTKDAIFVARRNLKKTQQELRLICPSDHIYRYLISYIFNRASYGSHLHSNNLRKKLQILIRNSVWQNIITNDRVMNLSNTPLNINQHIVLNLGLSFALIPEPKNNIDFIVGFDKYISKNNFDKQDNCLKGLLLTVVSEHDRKDPIPRRLRMAIESLKKLDIIITKSDKDGKIVIVDKNWYLNKAETLLSDDNTYEKLTKDPSHNAAAEFYRKIRRIGGDKKSIELLEKYKVITPKLPYFYGLPKTHKDGIPLRPIISSIGSYTYKLAKWLASLLSPFLGIFSNSHLKHSEDFISKFNSSNIPLNNTKLLSLDVDSLFTKVPIKDVLEFLSAKLEPYQDHFPLGLEKTIKLIELCVTNNIFSFNNSFYKQKFGCSMGSPLSPVISNLYMEYFESVIINDIKPEGMIWLRYVDDIFATWNSAWGDFDHFFNLLNNRVPSIKFKVEWEKDNRIPFLDVLIIRSPTGYKFAVYRKPTFSISYIHFFSYHDYSIKVSLASNLFLRALRICSNEYLESEFDTIKHHLKSIKYPDHTIEKAKYKANQIFYRPPNQEKDTFSNKINIPYIDSIKRLTEPLGKSNPFSFSYPNTIGSSLVNVYQKKTKNETGVYTIPCNECNKKYVGYTNKGLLQRITEHKRSVRYGQQNSAIFNHLSTENHTINWNASQIVYKSSCQYKSKIVESALILSTTNMNIHSGSWKPDLTDQLILDPIIKGIKENPG